MDEPFNEAPQTVQDYLRVLVRDVKEIKTQTIRTNGRVTAIEEWKAERVTQLREQAAYREGSSSALLTKKQASVAISVTTGIATIAGTIAGLIVKVAL